MAHKFDPKCLHRLDNPDRRKLLPPSEILKDIGLLPGQTFLDVGAGTGYFSLPASEIVGPEGRILALDSSHEMLQELKNRVLAVGVKNVETGVSPENGPSEPESVAAIALIAFVLHEVTDPKTFLSNIRKMLKAKGRLNIIEWKKETMEKGPPVQDRLAMKDVEILVSDSGYVHVESRSLNPAHYIVSAERER